jgi:Domain of unknown function (DUF4160)
MVTVHRQDGFRLVIYLEDHEPPHVHVYTGGAEAKIGLVAAQYGRPYVIRAFAMRAGDLRKAVQLVSEQQAMLVAKWRVIHG